MTRTQWLVMEPSAERGSAPFRTRLAGAGRHLPRTHLTTDDLMSTTRHHTHIDLERLTGIHERRVSVGDTSLFVGDHFSRHVAQQRGDPVDRGDIAIRPHQ